MTGESEDLARALNWLAVAEKASGDLDAAEHLYDEALRIARAVSFHEGIAAYTGSLAGITLRRKDWSGAELLARKALLLAQGVGQLRLIASTSYRLAVALVRQGKKADAFTHAQQAMDIYTRLALRDEVAQVRVILAECES